MRIAMDPVPLLGDRTGVGRYAYELLRRPARGGGPPEVTVTTLSARRLQHPELPDGARWRHRRIPSRIVRWVSDRETIPAELLLGRSDVFHATNFVAPPLRRTPIVATIHDLSYERFPQWVDANVARYREQVPRTLRRGALVVTHSHAVAEEVTDHYGLDPERVTAIAPGVDAAWATSAPPDDTWRQSRRLPPRYVLSVGGTGRRKNPHLLVEAYRRARALDGDVPPLVLVGPPPTDDVLSAMIAVGGHVLGFVTERHLCNVVAGAACVVMPSMYEGFGLPIIEAMAAGAPIVASEIPAHREASGGLIPLVPLSGTAATPHGDCAVDARHR